MQTANNKDPQVVIDLSSTEKSLPLPSAMRPSITMSKDFGNSFSDTPRKRSVDFSVVDKCSPSRRHSKVISKELFSSALSDRKRSVAISEDILVMNDNVLASKAIHADEQPDEDDSGKPLQMERSPSEIRFMKQSKTSLGASSTTSNRSPYALFMKNARLLMQNPKVLNFRRIVTDTKVKIRLNLLLFLILGAILLALIRVLISDEQKVSNIQIYNILHIILAILAEMTAVQALRLNSLFREAIQSANFISGNLTAEEILRSRRDYQPEDGLKLRRLIKLAAYTMVAVIIYLVYNLKYNEVNTLIGKYPCAPAYYPETFNMSYHHMEDVLSGSNTGARIYRYGLPLKDGAVGGWGAFPLYAPPATSEISIRQKGVVYASTAICDEPHIDHTSTEKVGTSVDVSYTKRIGGSFVAVAAVIFPPGSHTFDYPTGSGINNFSISQNCTIKFISGVGIPSYKFQLDEWGNISPKALIEIDLLDGTKVVEANTYSGVFSEITASSDMYYGQFETPINHSEYAQTYANVTQWIMESMQTTFAKPLYPLFNGKYSNVLQWGTNAAGLYDPTCTWKGFVAATVSITDLVLSKYDISQPILCDYLAKVGEGILLASDTAINLALISVSVLIALVMYQYLFWSVSFGSNAWKLTIADRILSQPVRLVYLMRNMISDLFATQKPLGMVYSYQIYESMDQRPLRLGESKNTLDEERGLISIAYKKKVAALRAKRLYE